jgi:2,5-dihydroxypyridine 5,6-dioxygenase
MVNFPLSPHEATDLLPLFREELKLCGITRGDGVVVFTDARSNPHYAAAALGAAVDLGAEVCELRLPYLGVTARPEGPPARLRDVPDRHVEFLRSATVVVDLGTAFRVFLYSRTLRELLRSGVRVLRVTASEDMLARLFPTAEVRGLTEASERVLAKGEKLRVTSPGGTDLQMDKAGREVTTQYGYTDTPGRWDSWPSGFLYTAPVEETAEGRLVLSPGDLLVHLGRYVTEPVVCTLKAGMIVEVEGGADAMLLRERLASWGEPLAYRISHIGWGTDRRAKWIAMANRPAADAGAEARSIYGNVQIAFGANYGIGGKNDVAAHEDIVMRHCTFWIDDRPVLEDERLVETELS